MISERITAFEGDENNAEDNHGLELFQKAGTYIFQVARLINCVIN